MSENDLDMINLVLNHLDHCCTPWWFDALKSVPVLILGEIGHFQACFAPPCPVDFSLAAVSGGWHGGRVVSQFLRCFNRKGGNLFFIIWGWTLCSLKFLAAPLVVSPPPSLGVEVTAFIENIAANPSKTSQVPKPTCQSGNLANQNLTSWTKGLGVKV